MRFAAKRDELFVWLSFVAGFVAGHHVYLNLN